MWGVEIVCGVYIMKVNVEGDVSVRGDRNGTVEGSSGSLFKVVYLSFPHSSKVYSLNTELRHGHPGPYPRGGTCSGPEALIVVLPPSLLRHQLRLASEQGDLSQL